MLIMQLETDELTLCGGLDLDLITRDLFPLQNSDLCDKQLNDLWPLLGSKVQKQHEFTFKKCNNNNKKLH